MARRPARRRVPHSRIQFGSLMTPQQLFGAGVRLFSLWLAITSLGYLGSIPAQLAQTPMGSGAMVPAAYAVGGAYLAGAIALWMFPMFVAHKLLPRTAHTNVLNVQAHDLGRVGSALIGLWFFARALPTVVWLVFRSLLFVDAGSSFAALPIESKLDIAVAAFELVFGAVLIAKAGVFAGLVVPKVVARASGEKAES